MNVRERGWDTLSARGRGLGLLEVLDNKLAKGECGDLRRCIYAPGFHTHVQSMLTIKSIKLPDTFCQAGCERDGDGDHSPDMKCH